MGHRVICTLGAGLAGVILFLGMAVAHAQDAPVPPIVQFSGALKDSRGQPLVGMQGVQFALYGDHKGGAPLWIETQDGAAGDKNSRITYGVMGESQSLSGCYGGYFSSLGEGGSGVYDSASSSSATGVFDGYFETDDTNGRDVFGSASVFTKADYDQAIITLMLLCAPFEIITSGEQLVVEHNCHIFSQQFLEETYQRAIASEPNWVKQVLPKITRVVIATYYVERTCSPTIRYAVLKKQNGYVLVVHPDLFRDLDQASLSRAFLHLSRVIQWRAAPNSGELYGCLQ